MRLPRTTVVLPETVPAQPRVIAPGVPTTPPSGVGVNPSFCICDILPISDSLKAICRQLLC